MYFSYKTFIRFGIFEYMFRCFWFQKLKAKYLSDYFINTCLENWTVVCAKRKNHEKFQC